MLFSAKSDVGSVRQRNEDAFFAESFPEPPFFFAVADGMGGHAGGEEAAQLAIEILQEAFLNWRLKVQIPAGAGPSEAPREFLVQNLRLANSRILAAARVLGKDGMGTTFSSALFWQGRLHLAHVGDSRIYLFRSDRLTRLTEDHSLVGELVRNGSLSEEEALVHPQRHVLTEALGTQPEARIDLQEVEVGEGDTFLLCTDGLTNLVAEPRLAALLQREPLEELTTRLIEEAITNGGHDNITVVVFRLEVRDFKTS
ncbi:MAG: Stp1/IreP family PP2C-type Ser/Thr phosphatase [Firmicutes bacterium]|nr:Stp1/IreP family PP2C-type Ser/Thr phosphatase [Bacillota bacterium]MCL5038291.1 Stp1/IreP family PP2C-type Ser/Thr phosphatase [Bacillota bacterium]